MEIPVVVSVFLLSLLAPGILYTINNVPAIQNALPLLGLGAAVLGTVQLLMFLSVRRKKNVDPLYYVFAEFCFTCVVGLTNALEQDGYISGFMTFYIKKGEPHLSTAYAVMMCYWEGVVHFLLLLTMIHRMFRGKSYRNLGLLWVGSSIAHQIIFVPGVVIGKYGSNIHPAFWRNAPFLLLPIWAAFLLFNRPRDLSIIPADKVEAVQKKGLLSRPIDLLLALGLLVCMGVCVFRGMVVLDCPMDACFNYIYQYEPCLKDPVGFPRLTMMVQLFYALPLLAVSLYGLQAPGCTWMLDWTLLFAGAIAQTQWCHIGGSLHSRTPFTYRMPTDRRWKVLLLNLVFLSGPVLLALRCHARPAFFMKLVPKGQSNREKKRN